MSDSGIPDWKTIDAAVDAIIEEVGLPCHSIASDALRIKLRKLLAACDEMRAELDYIKMDAAGWQRMITMMHALGEPEVARDPKAVDGYILAYERLKAERDEQAKEITALRSLVVRCYEDATLGWDVIERELREAAAKGTDGE